MLPKTIWCLWLQGWANAPDLVKACGASWRQHNPDWTIHYLSREALGAWLEPSADLEAIYPKNLPPEALSDVLRIELLRRFGGVWIDSTVYCLRPLDGWIHQAMPRGFFAFSRPAPDRMLSTWFLAAERGCHIIEAWRERTLAYWKDRQERDYYFWFHRLFEQAYASDVEFREIWDATPKLSADGPHCFAPYEAQLFKPVSDFDRLIVETAQTPMLKLTHKITHGGNDAGTTYRWLCDRVMRAPDAGDALDSVNERLPPAAPTVTRDFRLPAADGDRRRGAAGE
jgi:Capsular polysaccharide synthesis protein